MSRIEERVKPVRRYSVRVRDFVTLALNKGLAAAGLSRAQKTAGAGKVEIVRAVFPDKLSDGWRSKPTA